MITRPHTADLLELFAEQGNLSIEIDEVSLPAGHALLGKSIRESDAGRQFSILVLAVRRASGEMSLVAEDDYRLAVNDVMILVGRPDGIARFCRHHGL